jgi:peptide/nickel transport system substrate-binding protein
MRRFAWGWLAISSLLIAALAASAETRPRYGGTLHVAMRAAPASLDPADGQLDSFALRSLTRLMFDTLVASDESGRVQPSLATSWQVLPASLPGNLEGSPRWQFRLRSGVKFHDGTPLTAEIAAASLRTANPSWKVTPDRDSVVIELENPDPELPVELALPRNAIMKRDVAGELSGTGPFHIVDWQPGKKLTLVAEEMCWRGRPFLDGVEVEMGENDRDQMIALELGRADLVEVPAEQVHRVSLDGRRVASSPPVELLALRFARDAQTPEEKLLRDALAWSMERGSISSVLLQGAGQLAGGLLPNWISGYAFVFPTVADLSRARQEREQVHSAPAWALGYDGNDPISRLLAERIALNAKDAGLSLQPTTSAPDLQLVRIPLTPVNPWIALANATAVAGVKIKSRSGSVEDLYAAEQAALATQRIIPLVHLPVSYAAPTTLKNWAVRADGSWSLDDAWLESGKP